MKFKWLIIYCIFQLGCNFLFSQEVESFKKNTLRFKHFSLNKGLSQSSVLDIIQDNKGFLWFATRDGLNKYDGNSFSIFRHNTEDPTSISYSNIKSLFKDSDGNLWIGTFNGLNKYEAHNETFTKYFWDTEIWSIQSTSKDYLWIGTNLGLKKFDLKTCKEIDIINTEARKHIQQQIRGLYRVGANKMWICTISNIIIYDENQKTFTPIPYPENIVDDTNPNYTPVIFEDKDHTIWLGYRQGLAIYNPIDHSFKTFKIESDKQQSITDEVRSITQDHMGTLWIGTYNGFYILNSNKTSFNHIVHDENNKYSLSQNSIYKIFEDTKGDIWIGTYAGGINYYDRSFDVFKNFSSGANNTKLNYKVVSSIVEDPNNNLWIGTEGGGLNFYDKAKGAFTYYTHDPKKANSISDNNVKSVLRTSKGHFWIGTHDGGLNFLDTNKKPFQFKKFKNIPNDPNSLSNNRVISLLEDSQKNIWIGTSGGGLNKLNIKTKTISHVLNTEQHIGAFIYTISKTSNKEILLVGGNKGLIEINIKTNKVNSIQYKGNNTISNIGSATLCVVEDNQQNLWVSTEGDGLYYFNRKTKESIKYGIPQGLPNEVIYGILADNNNNIWLSTNNGLSRFNLKTKQFKNFDVNDGLLGNEFNYASYLKLSNGELMFGGSNGLNYFNPNNLNENAFIPPVSITSALVNNKPFPIQHSSKKQKEITLKHYQNVFSFNFIALSFSQSVKNQYAHKLEGFDENWNYIGDKKFATYTNLDAGTYIFKVKASNSDGLWNETGDKITINILPAPWHTWWAYLGYLILLTILLLAIRKQILIRTKERNELKQERLEKERIEQLNQLKLKLFTNISHDFRTPLTLIIGPLEQMIEKGEGNSFIKMQHKIMHRNACMLLQLINQLLDFRKSESGKLQIKASKNNMVEFIENVKTSFDEMSRVRNINYEFISDNKNIKVWFDTLNMKKVVFNLLSNAFKFTPDNGKITIELKTITEFNKKKAKASHVELIIKDNGKGIPQKDHELIFNRYYQVEHEKSERSGTGIGLSLTKTLVELHKGTIKVISTPLKETAFVIKLPLGKKHLNNNELLKEKVAENVFYSENSNYVISQPIPDLLGEGAEKTQNNSNPTILLVEDNNEVRSFIKSFFKPSYNVLEAENGKEALELANSNNLDLIISDVMMPVMDGIELCKNIKSNVSTSHIPVILLTAKTTQESIKSGYKTGADTYITKPFDAKLLELKIKNILDSRKHLIAKFKKDIILEPKNIAATTTIDEMFLKEAMQIVEDNLSNADFTVQNFASEMNMSRSVLYRKLKALTGKSILEFIKTIKLKRAAQLIISQEKMSISEIAFELGFNDLKHFRKSFQKQFNTLPSQYRDKYSNQNPNDTDCENI